MERANAQLSVVFSEMEKLKCEAHDQKTKEEGLQLLLRERDSKIAEWKQTCNAQSQHLEAVIALASVSDG